MNVAMRVAIALGVVAALGCSSERQTAGGSAVSMHELSPSARSHSVTSPVPVTKPAMALRVALTFDDLGVSPQSSDPALSQRILSSLSAQHAPVAVFANCQNLDDAALRLWQRAGATFGNHTASHLSVDTAGPDDAWWADVTSCDEHLRSALGEPVHFFRFPYLRYGKTAASHAQAAHKLASLGYSLAHVTAATSEWLLAGYYDEALKRRDAVLARDLARAYVDHMVQSLQAARDMAFKKARREVPHITLAHVNRLAADHFADVLSALQAAGWQFITLSAALADPVYALPDAYVGGCGCSWLARIEPALTHEDTYVFGDYEDQLRERFEERVKRLPEP
jgi:peptidoglycan/xylan/chitin deacetylase (PgdA/CDA1 family)